ncbi:MAG TPA: amino acid ABC transporter substrate-binding protein [Desulfobulbaceae bacterium]|nr:amino acid ABC transporter substrate-binding protein [Desulfobulbaceae bacterium]
MESGETSFALDYFRKLCATCHLWKEKGDRPDAPDFFNDKGGGSSACHVTPPPGAAKPPALPGDNEDMPEQTGKKPHPWLSKKVESDHCIRCHNRSARIGLSYIGKYEAEGYGTPFEHGQLSSRQLPGERFYLELADDIHHQRGMECIDCHTREEIMGDGQSYGHYEEQVEISCQNCHGVQIGKTEKGRVITNIVSGQRQLTGKVDGKIRPLHPLKEGACDFPAHKRLSCESCHSPWTPQCNGCHIERDMREKHFDALSRQETAGRWREGRSYIRYEKPMLAVWDNHVVIITPGCQDMVSEVDEKGGTVEKINRFTMAAINPHTIQAKGRACADCHAEAKTVGLGEGTIGLDAGGKLVFSGIAQGEIRPSGPMPVFDAYVDIEGRPLQQGSRPGLRPFNKEELRKILRVGLCVDCHGSYQDAAWKNYGSETKCPRSEKFLF